MYTSVRTLLQGQNVPRGTYLQVFLAKHISDSPPRRLARDTDTFEITIPAGYVVDDLPPPVDSDYSFASYHSKTEVRGGVIRYTRTFEVKELSVPVSGADELKKFYRTIAGDERNTVVLKAGAK